LQTKTELKGNLYVTNFRLSLRGLVLSALSDFGCCAQENNPVQNHNIHISTAQEEEGHRDLPLALVMSQKVESKNKNEVCGSSFFFLPLGGF